MTRAKVNNIFNQYVFESPDWCFPKYLFRLNAEHEELTKDEYQFLVEKFWDYVERRGDYAKGELPGYAAFFGTGMASGKDSTLRAVKQAFESVSFNIEINKVSTMFINLIHNPEFSLKEVNVALKYIMEKMPANVDIQFRNTPTKEPTDSVKILLTAYL